MAVVRSQYAKELERRLAKGESFDEAHVGAMKKGAVKIAKRKRSDRDEKVIKRVARKLREVFYGPKTYAKKKFRPSGRRK